MLILILIDVQHLWESAIGFEKDSDRQNDLSSGSLQPVTSPPPPPTKISNSAPHPLPLLGKPCLLTLDILLRSSKIKKHIQ